MARHVAHRRAWYFPHVYLVLLTMSAGMAGHGCRESASLHPLSEADSLAILVDNHTHRQEVDEFFRNGAQSPFKRDTSVEYTGINWFPVNPRFVIRSPLHRYAKPDTVVVMGTGGEARRQLRYGYFTGIIPDDGGKPVSIRLNVYKFTPHDSVRYAKFKDHLSLWFTDETTGEETYEVGRYIEVGAENPDPRHVYVIDLNKAYNPYCAYSSLYSCAIPLKEDHVSLALRAGEMKYHH
jgi:uncharacterized protein (DUF1684 family)